MARAVDDDELVEHWTLAGEELTLLAGKRGPTKLAFALMLKFHTSSTAGSPAVAASCPTRPSSSSPGR